MTESLRTSPSLLVRLRNGCDSEAWSRFADVYGPLVHGFLCGQGMQEADARDVAQDVLASVAADISRFEHRPERIGSFRRWLFTIVRNRTADYWRREKRQARGTGETVAHRLLAEIAGEDDRLEEKWNRDYERSLFRAAARQVQHDFQETSWQAFWRTSVNGESPQEVAADLGLRVAAVYVAKRRVLQRIQEQIAFLEADMK